MQSKTKQQGDSDNHGMSSSDQSSMLYDYSNLLDRMYDVMYTENPHLKIRTRRAMPTFQISRQRRSVQWSNFLEVCTVMKRSPQHVLSFLSAGNVCVCMCACVCCRLLKSRLSQLPTSFV